MGREQNTEAGERRIYTLRYGPGVPLLGMRRRGSDAGSFSLPEWLFLRNVRFKDGLAGRPPNEEFLGGFGPPGLAGQSVLALTDFQCTGPGRNKLYVIYSGCPGIPAASGGQSLNWYSHEPLEPFARGVYWASTTFEACLGVHDGSLFIGRDGILSRFIIVENDYEDDDPVFLAGLDQAEFLREFTGYTVRCLASAFGELFIGLENNSVPANSKVVRYDGLTFRDDVTGIDPPSSFGMFRNEQLTMTFSTAAGGLSLRDSAGAWTNVAGALGGVNCQQVEYLDQLWITEDSPGLWNYDGAALTIARTIATARISGLCEAFGYLFYGHDRGSVAQDATLGRYDGSTYVDEHKNLALQVAPVDFSWTRHMKRLSFYRGALIAGVESVLNGGRLFLTRADDTAGIWDIVTPVDPLAPSYGAIVAFAVF